MVGWEPAQLAGLVDEVHQRACQLQPAAAAAQESTAGHPRRFGRRFPADALRRPPGPAAPCSVGGHRGIRISPQPVSSRRLCPHASGARILRPSAQFALCIPRPLGNAAYIPQLRHQGVARGRVDDPPASAGGVRAHAGAPVRL
jgi:hypothetical protein